MADQAERRRHVREAIHNIEMEGLTVPAASKEDAELYVAGAIESDELIERVRVRYGLQD
ncbi:Hypothetical Protein NG00_00015 [Corynebacterium camporealensis]|uniref:Uncharacterized protein n=1 Tax=Corynebacterium camporealensis TaxID=161896 RepID=A0A0F6QWC8_9CORY|nr:hypothetical protein [Corynebacterium camporealensis]AKE38013.1 hypothetical protein UL81_00090 [Corynebacterium camporealensis]AVH87345.1 Hypothetical Protein NG00_00015 [Corynebacterium camporealensis]